MQGTKDIRLEEIKVGERHRKSLGDLTSLASSMLSVGLLHPIILTKEYVLVCGQRRLQAARSLKWSTIQARILDIDGLVAERDENTVRKDFSPSEAVAIGKTIEEREREKAKERQAKAGPKEGKGAKRSASEKFTEPIGESADKAAAAVGMSRPTYTKAKEVVTAAEDEPEHSDLVDEMDRTGKVDPAHKKLKQRQQGKCAATAQQEKKHSDPDNNPEDRKSRGKGLTIAHEAINLLATIPKNDALRKRGFQVVLDWVQRNLRNMQ